MNRELDNIKVSLTKEDNDGNSLTIAYNKLSEILQSDPELIEEVFETIKVGLSHEKNNELSLRAACEPLSTIGAKFIDDGRYDEFMGIIDMGIDPRQNADFGGLLMDKVKTLKGAEFMETEGFIPSGYFAEGFAHCQDASLLRAYPEQIDFYIKRGADVNAEDEFGQNVVSHMLYRSRPSEMIEKIVNAGGDIKYCENAWDNLVSRLTDGFDEQICYYGHQSIGRTLENVNLLIKHGYKLDYKDTVTITANLAKKTPEFMEIFKPGLEKEDLLQLKNDVMKLNINEYNNDLVYKKDNEVEESEFSSLGKTGDSNTGEVTEVHEETAKIQTQVAKQFMKNIKVK